MVLEINRGNASQQLANMTGILRQKPDDVRAAKTAIEAFINSPDLEGPTYDSFRSQYTELHFPVLQGLICYFDELLIANDRYSGKMDILKGGYLNEDHLHAQLAQARELRNIAETVVPMFADLTEKIEHSIQDKLDSLYTFEAATQGLYATSQGVLDDVRRGIACIESSAFNPADGTYSYPVGADMSWRDRINAAWMSKQTEGTSEYPTGYRSPSALAASVGGTSMPVTREDGAAGIRITVNGKSFDYYEDDGTGCFWQNGVLYIYDEEFYRSWGYDDGDRQESLANLKKIHQIFGKGDNLSLPSLTGDAELDTFMYRALLERGYHEGLSEGDKSGSNNHTKYGDIYYGHKVWGEDYPWCATFVTWCADQAGIMNTVVPKYQGCWGGTEEYQNKDLLYPASKYTPKAGDVFFKDLSHTGIVLAYDPIENCVYTIEGNCDQEVKIIKRPMSYFTSFGSNEGTSNGVIPSDYDTTWGAIT